MKNLGRLGILATLGLWACDGTGGLVQLSARLEVSPNPIVLPETPIGLESRVSVQLLSRGEIRLELASMAIEGSEALRVEGPALPLALEPGGEAAVGIVFRPQSAAPESAFLVIRSNDLATPELRVPIEAAVQKGPVLLLCIVSPDLGLSERCVDEQASLDLGVTSIGSVRTATVTLRSVGDTTVEVDHLALAAGGSPELSLAALDGPFLLAPGASVTRSLRYAPVQAGQHQATVEAAPRTSAANRPSFLISARATPAALCADPEVLDFGDVSAGGSATANVQLKACAGSTVAVQSISAGAGDFALLAPFTGPVRLQPIAGLGLTVAVRYTPSTVGRHQGTLRVESDAGPLDVAMIGSSGACDLRVAPESLSFSDSAARRTFLIENAGSRACQVTGLDFGAGTDPSFSFAAALPSLPLALIPGASHAVDVDYANPNQGGVAGVEGTALGTVVVDFEADGERGQKTVQLSAGNTPDPEACRLELTPGIVSFGVVPLGATLARTIVVANTGTGPCNLSSVDFIAGSSPAFSFERQGGLTIYPGDLIAGVIRFSSSVVASETGTLRIDRSDPTAPDLDVPVSASTSGPLLCVSPPRLDFGDVPSGSAVVSLTACGTAPVTITQLGFTPLAPEFSFNNPGLPLTIATGDTQTLTISYAPVDSVGDVTELVISSNDAGRPEQRVLLTGGANVPEICNNGLDEDGDGFIDENCVPGPAIGRAVILGQGRLFVWGDEHVKMASYGARPAPFWRGVFNWLTCAGCPGPRRVRIGDLNSNLNPLMRAEASALGLDVVNVGGSDAASLAGVDAILVVANYANLSPDLEPWIRQGGAAMFMAIGLGPDECTDSLDAELAPFPLRYECNGSNPWGPVGQFYPHPISSGLAPDATPFVNGRFVAELPGTNSTVIAVE